MSSVAFIVGMVTSGIGVPRPLNWTAGWGLILAAFLVGAVIGLRTHRDEFLGGYASFRRRMVRLGHIALACWG